MNEISSYQISKYIILDRIGQGAGGEVFLVCDGNTEIYYALKRFSDRKSAEEEMEILKMLNHPGIPKVHDFFTLESESFLVMDYEEGVTLADYIFSQNPPNVSKKDLFLICLKIAEILSYLHTLPVPVVHGDLKPENIIYTKNGEVKLIDFGSAHPLTNIPKKIFSTPGYAAPEMGEGRSSLKSDVYAFGNVFAQIMSGRDLDFAGKSRAVLMRFGLSHVEAKLAAKCLNPNETARFASGKDILRALNACGKREKISRIMNYGKSFICTDIGGILAFFGLFMYFLQGFYRGKYLILAGCILLLTELISVSAQRVAGNGEIRIVSSVFLAER